MGRGLLGRGIRAFATVVLTAAAGCSAARAETKIETKIVDFDMPGATALEVGASFIRSGPTDFAGHGAFAKTAARIGWRMTPVSTDKGCAATSVVVTAEITIAIPRFVDASRMSPKLKRGFSAFRTNLLGHERGHEKRFVAAVQRIDKRIRALPPQPSCAVTRERAEAIGYDVIQELDQANRAYDLRERRRATGDLRFPSDE